MTISSYSKEPVAKCTGAFYCELDAEPLERYRKGGYHPTHLGAKFNDGRYKTVHENGLGWLRNCLAYKRPVVSIY